MASHPDAPDGPITLSLMAPRLALHRFTADRGAPSTARQFARTTLANWGLDDVSDTVELLVSEAVTNAVGHAGSGGEMVIRRIPSGIRIEVSDYGSGEVLQKSASPEDVTGRGVAIIDALASRWGVEDESPAHDSEDHKTVWFEFDHESA